MTSESILYYNIHNLTLTYLASPRLTSPHLTSPTITYNWLQVLHVVTCGYMWLHVVTRAYSGCMWLKVFLAPMCLLAAELFKCRLVRRLRRRRQLLRGGGVGGGGEGQSQKRLSNFGYF